jgi:hypothetical protein
MNGLNSTTMRPVNSFNYFPNTTRVAEQSTLLSDLNGTTLSNQGRDWEAILASETARMKRKERDNKSMIDRLSGELKRE